MEGLAVLRLCIEYAGYAALIASKPSLARAWFDRDTDASGKAAVRKAFTHAAIKASIERSDLKLCSVYSELYERLIQFGAHLNEKSVAGNLKIDEELSGPPSSIRFIRREMVLPSIIGCAPQTKLGFAR
ncbi:hypothetical protein ACF1BQ_014035 [Bradyrhizobium sp. RDT10]